MAVWSAASTHPARQLAHLFDPFVFNGNNNVTSFQTGFGCRAVFCDIETKAPSGVFMRDQPPGPSSPSGYSRPASPGSRGLQLRDDRFRHIDGTIKPIALTPVGEMMQC